MLAAANVNSKNKKGQTPLMIAACGEINVLKLLTSDPKIEVDLQVREYYIVITHCKAN